jgi:hypothetical protein
MIKEVDLGGVYVSPFLAYMAVTGMVWFLIRRALDRAGFYRLVWHPALFNTALYVILLSMVVVVTM